jgi:hypothetical protein
MQRCVLQVYTTEKDTKEQEKSPLAGSNRGPQDRIFTGGQSRESDCNYSLALFQLS